MLVEVVIGDIAKQADMEALVNTANPNLRMGSGVAGGRFWVEGFLSGFLVPEPAQHARPRTLASTSFAPASRAKPAFATPRGGVFVGAGRPVHGPA